jgi:hypothetical protein
MLERRAALLIFAAPSKLMLELRAGLLIFAAPSKLAHGAVAPSGLLPDVVWGCSDFLLLTSFLRFSG